MKSNDKDGAKKLVEEMRESLLKISDDIVQSDADITEADKDELIDDAPSSSDKGPGSGDELATEISKELERQEIEFNKNNKN